MIEQYEVAQTAATTINIIEFTDDLRRTPIFFASACKSPEPLKYLISKGAKYRDIKGLVDRSGDEISPILIAVQYGRANNIPYLLGRAVDDESAYGQTG